MPHLIFDTFKYLFPPRTEMKIPPGPGGVRKIWEGFPDALAQFKMDGTRNLMYVFPDQHVECWNRHEEKQKQYTLTPSMAKQVRALNLPAGKFHVLDGELIHAKTKNIKDVMYMFDILVFDGEYLIGENYITRYNLLASLMKGTGSKLWSETYFPSDFSPIEGRMYLAENYPATKWEWMWQVAQSVDFCEGMVLKRTGPVSALTTGYRQINNDGFMLRVRKPKKNYKF